VTARHRPFSLRRVGAIARITLVDLTRQKVLYGILIFAAVLIGSSAFMARLTFQQELQVLKDIGLGAISIFTALLAVLATARLLPQEIEDRTIYTILAKPVERIEYLLGKYLGVLLLLAISTLLMSALFLAVVFFREETILSETARQMSSAPADQLSDVLRGVRQSGLTPSLLPGIAIIYLKAAVLAALTLFVSTFATTNIFTIVTMAFIYAIGHLQGVAREYWLQNSGGFASRTFLALVALMFPDLQLFNLVDEVVAGARIPAELFAKTVGLGGYYIVMYIVFAWAAFYRKEL
jgi:ABC-type Na+ efflux pump permease subunit